jgi:ADP-ribose pyrophosphatase
LNEGSDWQRIESRPIRDYRIFRSREDVYRSPQGVEHPFTVLETPDWVNVIALTTEQQVVMVRQFRHGVGEETWEFPGGLVDPGESTIHAARRELLEETGYSSEETDWMELGWVYPNPAVQDNRCWTYLARNARAVAKQSLDATEHVDAKLWPVPELEAAFGAGHIRHALMGAAWLQFKLRS